MLFGKKKEKIHFNPGNRDDGVNENYVEQEINNIEEDDVEVVLNNEETIDKKM